MSVAAIGRGKHFEIQSNIVNRTHDVVKMDKTSDQKANGPLDQYCAELVKASKEEITGALSILLGEVDSNTPSIRKNCEEIIRKIIDSSDRKGFEALYEFNAGPFLAKPNAFEVYCRALSNISGDLVPNAWGKIVYILKAAIANSDPALDKAVFNVALLVRNKNLEGSGSLIYEAACRLSAQKEPARLYDAVRYFTLLYTDQFPMNISEFQLKAVLERAQQLFSSPDPDREEAAEGWLFFKALFKGQQRDHAARLSPETIASWKAGAAEEKLEDVHKNVQRDRCIKLSNWYEEWVEDKQKAKRLSLN